MSWLISDYRTWEFNENWTKNWPKRTENVAVINKINLKPDVSKFDNFH